MARKRLGELLLERKLVTREQLEQGLAYQRQTGHRLGAALVALRFLSENALCEALAQALGLEAVTTLPPDLDWSAVQSLRARFCEANDLVGIALANGSPRKTLTVAMADPLNIPAIEEIEFTTGMKVKPVIAPLSIVRQAIRRYFLKGAGEDQHHADEAMMTIVRAGGHSEVVHTSSSPAVPVAAPQAPAAATAPVTEVEDLPELEPEPLEGAESESAAVAQLIAQRHGRKKKRDALGDDLSFLLGVNEGSSEAFEQLEHRFWALCRILARKGLLTREELLQELDRDGED